MSAKHKPFKRGDYILLPFRGKRIDLLCRLIRPLSIGSGHWQVKQVGLSRSYIYPSPHNRCSPSLAKRILNGAKL